MTSDQQPPEDESTFQDPSAGAESKKSLKGDPEFISPFAPPGEKASFLTELSSAAQEPVSSEGQNEEIIPPSPETSIKAPETGNSLLPPPPLEEKPGPAPEAERKLPALPGAAKPLWKRKLGAALIALSFLLILYLGIYLYALSVLDGTGIELKEIRVLSSGNDTLELEIDVTIDNPSLFSATLEKGELELYFRNYLVAEITVPEVKIGAGENTITLASTLESRNDDILLELTRDVLDSQTEPKVKLKGELRARKVISFNMAIDREISIPPSPENITASIQQIDIPVSNETGLRVEMNVTAHNPGRIATTLDGLAFGVWYNDFPLAIIPMSGFLERGNTSLELAFWVPHENGMAAEELSQVLLNDEDIQVLISGLDTGSLLSYLTTAFDYNYLDEESSLGGLSDIDIEMNRISILDSDDTGVYAELEAYATNPSTVSTTLDGLSFLAYYNGSELAVVDTSGYLAEGNNTLTLSVFIPGRNSQTANLLIGDLLDGKNANFQVHGQYRSGHLLSRLAAGFSYDYLMEATGGIVAHVQGFELSSIGLFTSQISADVLIENPSPIDADLGTFEFSAYYQGTYLGPIEFDNPHIYPGDQDRTITLTVSTLSLQNLGLLANIALGSPIELLIEGKRVFDPENTLEFSMTVTL